MFVHTYKEKNYLYLYDGSDEMYFLGLSDEVRDRNWKKVKMMESKEIPTMSGTKPFLIGSTLYEFGGVDQYNECSKSMIVLDLRFFKRYTADNVLSPSPRYDYSVCSKNETVYLFGGRDKNNIFNDLYAFNNSYWSPIYFEGLCPPPLHSSVLFDCGEFLMLDGGESFEFVHDGLYSLDLKNNKVYSSKITGPSLPNVFQSDQYQLPRKNHKCCSIYDKLFIIDGYADVKKKEAYPNSFIIHGINDLTTTIKDDSFVISHLRKMKDSKKFCDVVFLTMNEDKSGYNETEAHKCIVSSRCLYFKDLILNSNNRIIVSDASTLVLEEYLNFLYTGCINLSSTQHITQFLYFAKKCKTHYSLINQIINSVNIYSDIHKVIIDDIKTDFFSLINDKTFSDMKFEIIDPETFEKKYLYLHLVFLEQSNYFKSIINSGMKESIEHLVSFNEIKFNNMNQIINFLYTDDLLFDSSSTIELFVDATLFQLNEIVTYCRKIIVSNIDFENSLELIFLADLYSDSMLINACITFIVNHYEEYENEDIRGIPSSSAFQILQSITKRQKMNEKKEKKQLIREAKSILTSSNNIINKTQLKNVIANLKKNKL
jgi:hypothetical protein